MEFQDPFDQPFHGDYQYFVSPLPGAYRSLQVGPNTDGQHWAWHPGRASTSYKVEKVLWIALKHGMGDQLLSCQMPSYLNTIDTVRASKIWNI